MGSTAKVRRFTTAMPLLAAPLFPALSTAQSQAVHARIDATITAGQEPGVQVQEEALPSMPGAVVAPQFSVSIYSFEVAPR